MSEELDINTPKRIRRASNRIGTKEIDEDGWVWLSHSKHYSCTGTAVSEDESYKEK